MPENLHKIPSEELNKIEVNTETITLLAVEDILEQIGKLKSQKVNTTLNTDKISLKVSLESKNFTKNLKSDLQDLFESEFGRAGKHVHLKFKHRRS